MPDEIPSPTPAARPTAEEKAAARLAADNAKVIEAARVAQSEALDVHEALAYARARDADLAAAHTALTAPAKDGE